MPPETKLILIGGPTCSGKTQLARKMVEALGGVERCNSLHMDGWYKPDLPNFDVPSAVYIEEFERDVLTLLQGSPIGARDLGQHTNQRPISNEMLHTKPFLVVEGVYVLAFDSVVAAASLKLFMEISPASMCLRRIRRDAIEYGENLSDVLFRIEHQVLPGTKEFVLPTRARADLVLEESEQADEHLMKALELL